LISDLYKAINGENDINDSTYSSITNIIDQVNQNDYSSIPKCENIVILTELLFIWLNECVVNIINPKKVNKIYSTGLNETSERETKGKSMGDVISNFTQESEENIMEVLDYITDTFSKNEYATLKYIALFLLLIYPSNDENKNEKMINEYYLAEQKLSIFCLGYNLDIFIQTEDNIENEKTTVEQTKNLLEMFMFFNKKNHKEGTIDDNNKTNKEMNNIDEQKQYEMYLELKKKFEQNENKNQIYNTMLLSTVRGKTDPFFNETRNDIVINKERYNIKCGVGIIKQMNNEK
jgi:acyl-CoA-binding protein